MASTSAGEISHGTVELNIKYLITREFDEAVKDKIALEIDLMGDNINEKVLYNRFVKSFYRRFMYIYDHTECEIDTKTLKRDDNGKVIRYYLLDNVDALKITVANANNGGRLDTIRKAIGIFNEYTKMLKEKDFIEKVAK